MDEEEEYVMEEKENGDDNDGDCGNGFNDDND